MKKNSVMILLVSVVLFNCTKNNLTYKIQNYMIETISIESQEQSNKFDLYVKLYSTYAEGFNKIINDNKGKTISIIYNDEILNSQKIDDNTNSDKIFFKSFKTKKDALSFIEYERIINSYRTNELIKNYNKKKENDNPLKEAAIKLMAEGIMKNDRKKVIESKKKFINLIYSDNIDTRIIISVLEIDMYLYNWEIFKKDFDEFFPLLAESDKNGYSYYLLGLASLVFDRDDYDIYFGKAIELFRKDRTNYNSFINIITVYSILEQPEKAKFYYETNKDNFDDYTNFSTDHLFDLTQEYMINVIVEQREKLK